MYKDGEEITNLEIPGSVTSIGEIAFYGCTGLTSVTIPESVTSIGRSAFSGCIGLTSITISGSVTSIGESAFSGCTSLTSITIPEGVTSIGDAAFNDCSALTEITCKAIASPTCGKDVFKGVDKSIPLYVPKGSVIKYKAADVWRDFVIIREIAEAGSDVYLTINDGSKGNVKLKVNDAQPYFSLKIEPEAGWHIHSVTFNDGDVTAELSADGEYVTPVIGTDSQLGIVYAQGSSSINSVSDSKIRVWASGNSVIVEGAEFGKTINVYTIDGIMAASVNADSDRVVIPLQSGDVYIVKIGEQTLKVAL